MSIQPILPGERDGALVQQGNPLAYRTVFIYDTRTQRYLKHIQAFVDGVWYSI